MRWRLVSFAVAIALALPASGLAQTARLTGSVSDADTSTPVVGASIRIVALDIETVTTSSGRFVLAGIPAGSHDVAIDLLGYTSLRLLAVVFRAGRPTELAIRLQRSPVALAPIVVESDRIPLIEPEVSETREIIPGELLRELPVTRIGEVIDLATGVSDGHFRGGQTGQEVYLVDGFALKNQLEATTGGASIELAPTSLREIEIVTGGFNAEYGSALSGVVSYRTRSGSTERWEG
ncbi:MAG: carboxypeptidase regulatory-like domain-containing protein, partial [Gemmatimonadota bacterium]